MANTNSEILYSSMVSREQFLAALPPPEANTDDIQKWLLSWLADHDLKNSPDANERHAHLIIWSTSNRWTGEYIRTAPHNSLCSQVIGLNKWNIAGDAAEKLAHDVKEAVVREVSASFFHLSVKSVFRRLRYQMCHNSRDIQIFYWLLLTLLRNCIAKSLMSKFARFSSDLYPFPVRIHTEFSAGWWAGPWSK